MSGSRDTHLDYTGLGIGITAIMEAQGLKVKSEIGKTTDSFKGSKSNGHGKSEGSLEVIVGPYSVEIPAAEKVKENLRGVLAEIAIYLSEQGLAVSCIQGNNGTLHYYKNMQTVA